MDRHFDADLADLKNHILQMGGNVEKAIEESVQILLRREPERGTKVFQLEEMINQAHIHVDEECLRLLARRAPVATDLRLILAVIKINTDLERMGDQAINIVHNAKLYLTQPTIKPLQDLPRMALEVQKMVRDALDAFVRGDEKLAREVLKRDDMVDGLKDQIFDELIPLMEKDPTLIQRGLELILIARNLERMGDHATNIAEDVIFVTSGIDIRHVKGNHP